MNIERINELFKCKFCQDVYKQPVILTCGHKICTKDIKEITTDTKIKYQDVVKCHICETIMVVPDKGFLIDKDFSIFTDMSGFKGIDFGAKYKRSKESIESFRQEIEGLEYLIKNPDFYIDGYFQNLRKEIDIERDGLVHEINIYYTKLLDEVGQVESICKLSKPLELLKPMDNLGKIEKEIGYFNGQLQKLSNDIDNMKVNEDNWDKISFESGYQKMKLSQIIEKYTNNLLTNKSYKFVPKKSKFLEILEDLKIDHDHARNKDWTEAGFFQFKLPDFSTFTSQKDSVFKTDTFLFKGFKWFLKLRNLDEKNLCWTIHCDRDQEDANKIVSTTNRFEIVNLKEPGKSNSSRLKLQFKNDSKGHGVRQYLSFQDIYSCGFYDAVHNSIQVNVFIQIDDIHE